MIPSLSSFNKQSVSGPYEQATQGVRTLRQIDGTPGDKNPNPNAISMKTSLGTLDAVVLTNQDRSETVVQRLTKTSGDVQTSWLEIPQKGNGIPNLHGFEINSNRYGLRAVDLTVKETYVTGGFGIPDRTYDASPMGTHSQIQNSLMRAEAVLAAWIIA